MFDIMIGMIVSGPWRPVHKKRLRARVPSFTAYLWEVLFLSPLSRLNGLVGIRTGVVLCCVVLFVFFLLFSVRVSLFPPKNQPRRQGSRPNLDT